MSEGKVTPINPGVLARIGQAARYAISGVKPDTWFGPMQPITPVAPPEVKGRAFDYPVGYNLNYTPRTNEAVSFGDLRALADNCDILRSVIETRKDQIIALDWTIRVKNTADKKQKDATPDQKKRIDFITEFFQKPDKQVNFNQWVRQILEDMFVIDAVAVYKRPTRGNTLYALEIIAGETIKPLLDDSGRFPVAPDPAYQQILHGIPAADYTADELIYYRNNPRSYKVYGYSQVEQVILTVNTLIRRALHQLEYYRDGSQPDAFMGLPKEWNTDQIVAFQRHFDSMMAGNSAMRRRLKFMPGDFKYQATKEPTLKDDYDEWLARIICYVFSVPPTPFIKQMNRATAENATEMAQQEGLVPLQHAVYDIINPIIAHEFGSPDLEFSYIENREQDPSQQQVILSGYVSDGIMSIDESRERLGLEPIGGVAATNMVKTATGYVAIGQSGCAHDDGAQDNPGQENENAGDDDPAKAAYSRLGKAGGQQPVPFHRAVTDNARREIKKILVGVFKKTAESIAAQVRENLGKLAKADDDTQPQQDDSHYLDEAAGIVALLSWLGIYKIAYLIPIELQEVFRDSALQEAAIAGVAENTAVKTAVNQKAYDYATQRAAEMVGKRFVNGELVDSANAEMVITDTMRQEIRSIIADGLASGIGRDGIAKNIINAAAFSPQRAELIANTEVGTANGNAALEGMRQARAAGVNLKKIWYPDAEACPICLGNAAVGAIDLEEEFPGGVLAPLQHPNCECTIISKIL